MSAKTPNIGLLPVAHPSPFLRVLSLNRAEESKKADVSPVWVSALLRPVCIGAAATDEDFAVPDGLALNDPDKDRDKGQKQVSSVYALDERRSEIIDGGARNVASDPSHRARGRPVG